MDIVDFLSGGESSSDIQKPSAGELSVNLQEDDLVKSLKGSFSEKSTKKDIAPKTSKAMWKQVNNSLTKIYNIVTNNSKPTNHELYERVNSISKELIDNKVLVTELKENLVKSPVDELREADDNKETAEAIIKDSINEVITESETIASIEDKLVDLETKVGVNNTKANESTGLLSGMLNTLTKIPGPIGLVATLVKEVLGFVSSFPQVFLILGFLKEGVEKALDYFKPLTESIASIKDMIPGSVKDFFTSSDNKITDIVPDISKTAVKEGTTEVAEKGLTKVAEKGLTKVAEKSIFKSLLKKIPILGALVGAGFSIPRVLEGDYEGASMELASGIASTIPGLGTAASVGIDAALFAKDMKNPQQDITPVDIDISSDKTKKVIDSVKPVTMYNENTTINNSSSNIRNVSMEENERDFILASKF